MSKLILIFTLGILSIGAFAGSTVCSGKDLYYSDVRFDMGMRPPIGYKIGHRTIVFQGKVLVRHDLIMNSFPGQVTGGLMLPAKSYVINLAHDDIEVIHTSGNTIGGSKVFKTMATLVKNPLPGQEDNVIANEPVICENKWAMVP